MVGVGGGEEDDGEEGEEGAKGEENKVEKDRVGECSFCHQSQRAR